ncbi:hypothetical protein KAU09_01695, partial [Candidatus Parcubacteria bacterium]|nr:hypothetical protein [Candidatus Parcubacteria bacterium]
MRRFLNIIVRGLIDTYKLYDIIHLKVFDFLFAAIAIFMVGITLNYFDLMIINGFLGIIFIIAATFIASQPKIVAGLVGIGTGTKLKEPINGTTDALKVWTMFLGQMMIWVSIFFLVCATIHFDRNIGVMPIIILGLFIIFLAAPLWGFQSKLLKKLVYGYAIIMVIVYSACMISPASYKHYTGVDPIKFFRANMSDKKIAEIEDIQEEQADEHREKKLEKIEAKIKKRKKLTSKEEKILQDSKKKRDNRSIPVKAKGVANSSLLAIKNLFGGDELTDEEKIAIEDGYYARADKIKIKDPAKIKTPKDRQEVISRLSKKVPLFAKARQYTNRYEAEYQLWLGRLELEGALGRMIEERGNPRYVKIEKSGELNPAGIIPKSSKIT